MDSTAEQWTFCIQNIHDATALHPLPNTLVQSSKFCREFYCGVQANPLPQPSKPFPAIGAKKRHLHFCLPGFTSQYLLRGRGRPRCMLWQGPLQKPCTPSSYATAPTAVCLRLIIQCFIKVHAFLPTFTAEDHPGHKTGFKSSTLAAF